MRLTILTMALVALMPPPEQLLAEQAIPPGVDPGVVKRRFDPPLRPDPELYRCLVEQRKSRATVGKEKPAPPGRPSDRDDDGKIPVCPENPS